MQESKTLLNFKKVETETEKKLIASVLGAEKLATQQKITLVI